MVLFITGICPIQYHNKQTVRSSSKAYFVFLITYFASTFIILYVLRVVTNPARIQVISGLTNTLQGLASGTVHILLLLVSVRRRAEHANFLNNFAKLDQNLSEQFKISIFRETSMSKWKMVLNTFGYSVVYLAIIIWSDSMTFDVIPLWHNKLLKVYGMVFMTTRCMIALHMRYCAIIMRQQRSIVSKVYRESIRIGEMKRIPILMVAMKDMDELKQSFWIWYCIEYI